MQDPMMQFFAYDHLPPALQVHSKPFAELAELIVDARKSRTHRRLAKIA
jgi:hypothetical protein